MLQPDNIKLRHQAHRLISLISVTIILISLTVYIGTLHGIFPEWINIKINTAICFLLAGFALLLINYKNRGLLGSITIMFISTLNFLISSITLLEYLTGIDLHIDQLIMNDDLARYSAMIYLFTGRMAISTAVNFVLISLCFFIILSQSLSIWIMQTLIWIVMLITITALFLFFYDHDMNTIIAIYASMSVPAILLFLLLGIGLLLTKPEAGIVGILLKNNFTGHFLRCVVIIPIVFPIALVQIVFFLHKTGVIAYSTEMLMLQIGFLTLTGLIIAISSRMLDRKEGELRKSQSQTSAIKTKAIKQMRHVIQHDFLTGLLNRTGLEKKLNKLISDYKSKSIVIIVLNIDRFKLIVETLGLKVSDRLLKVVATRLSNLMEHTHGGLARLETDKFSMYIHEIDKQTAIELAQKIHDKCRDSFEFDNHRVKLTISIGISMYPRHGIDGNSLIQHAALAMFDANERGGNQTTFFTNALPQIASKKITMYMDLRKAITSVNELTLVYQPQIDLKSGRIFAVEALVRWQHPVTGLIYPNQFIPFAEKNSLIVPLNERIMRLIFEQISLIELKTPVSINISAQQFEGGFQFVDYIESLMREFNINAEWIGLEITENMIVEDTAHNIAVLKALNKLGFQISIDDFGKGFSSFSYLQRLPVHKIKIDKSFISGLPTNPANVKIVKAIIALAHSLDMTVIAEGAETEAEVEFLKQEHCDLVQGFYYYKPMSFYDLHAIIESQV